MDENQKQELKQDAKTEALEYAEDVTKETIEHVFEFSIDQINKHGNTMLKALIPVLQTVESYLLELADKIDGVQDNA